MNYLSLNLAARNQVEEAESIARKEGLTFADMSEYLEAISELNDINLTDVEDYYKEVHRVSNYDQPDLNRQELTNDVGSTIQREVPEKSWASGWKPPRRKRVAKKYNATLKQLKENKHVGRMYSFLKERSDQAHEVLNALSQGSEVKHSEFPDIIPEGKTLTTKSEGFDLLCEQNIYLLPTLMACNWNVTISPLPDIYGETTSRSKNPDKYRDVVKQWVEHIEKL